MKTIKQQTGFTLVELVTTVTIVGVLAAVAIPRFANLSTDARESVIKNTADAMKHANDTIFSKASSLNIVNLSSGNANAFVSLGGQTINIHYGFAANAAELYKALVAHPDVAVGTVDNSALGATALLYNSSYTGITAATLIGPDGTIRHTKAQDPSKCEAGYTKAASTSTVPMVLILVSDCS
ncbi:MAG: type II secretion system protein [Burkholderiales bacterium]